MSRRDKFNEVLKKHGYRSLNQFCLENKLHQTNFNKRIKDESIRVDIDNLFLMADLLHEPIETMIEIFYPEDLAENRKCIEQ